MNIRKMTPSEIDSCGTYGTKRDLIVDGYTDDTGGVVLFRACHEVTTDGKLPTYGVLECRLFQVVLAGKARGLNTYDDDIRAGMNGLSKSLVDRIPSLISVHVTDSSISSKYLKIHSRQTVRGTKKGTVFGLPEQQVEEILPLVCEVVLRAARREVAADRKRWVDREAQTLLNHVGSHLWKEAATAVNYKERLTALQTERHGAFEAARLALLANAREELSELQIDDEEVLQAVITGLDTLKRPRTLVFTDD